MLDTLAERIRTIAEKGGGEGKLQLQVDPRLKQLLVARGIPYDPDVNRTLRRLGYSQVSADRPDSVFGHVVLDYKDPGLLSRPARLAGARGEMERYLDSVAGGGPVVDPSESAKWAGVLRDGFHLTFCHSTGFSWVWTELYETSGASLLSLIQLYRSLGRLPLNAKMLTRRFGRNSEVATGVLPVMCSHLSKPSHRTMMLFREWRRLLEQVSTYGLSQLPSLKAWAGRNGIATNDASQTLFPMHTYYSLVVKLVSAELLGGTQTTQELSLAGDIANARDEPAVYSQLAKLEDGDFYRNYRISNFLEGDFFSWYASKESPELAGAIRCLARTFQEFEPATPKFKPESIKVHLHPFLDGKLEDNGEQDQRHEERDHRQHQQSAEQVQEHIYLPGQPTFPIVAAPGLSKCHSVHPINQA